MRTLVLAAFVACLAFAGGHKSLNGTWTLLPARSDFAGQPVVQSGTVTIDDREGNITVSRSFVYEGIGETSYYSDTVDGQKHATIHNGKDFKSKARWDGDVLRVTTTQSGAVTDESYSLAPDGSMMASVMRPGQLPVRLVFQRM